MRLNSIFVENFQGLQSATLELPRPITVVTGMNGAGKSSLKEAIGVALGEPARVSLKKDYGQMVTEGHKKGQVVINHDDASSSFTLPKGVVEHSPVAGEEYLHFVLNPQAFAAMDDKSRRGMLFKLSKASASPNVTIQKLRERGADADKAEKIKSMLLSGFPAAQQSAKDYAAEARGAWKAITGEVYGSEKAEGWAVTIPEGQDASDANAEDVFKLHETAAAEVEKGVKFLGGLEAKREAAAGYEARKAQLSADAELLERAEIKKGVTELDLSRLVPKVEAMAAELNSLTVGAESCDCPGCGIALKIAGNKVELFDGIKGEVKKRSDLALELTKTKDAVAMLNRTLQNDVAAVTTAANAKAELDKLLADGNQGFDQALFDKTTEALTAQRLKSEQLRAKYNALFDRERLIKSAAAETAKAAAHHQDVVEWVLIEKALAPDGIPTEILKGALQPINDTLAQLSTRAKWPKVEIDTQMAITAGGRLYGLLSESEKWRCDTLLGLTVSKHAGLKFLVLDRFDVLDLPGRGQLLGMLVGLAKSGELDSAVVCGTLKEKPKDHPAINAVWIEGGTANGAEQLQQAS
jgi:hypothetical protein